MQRLFFIVFCLTGLLLSGCNFYSDDPPERTISGTILIDATGQPLSGALVEFGSKRKRNPYFLLPVDSSGVAAITKTDNAGHFFVRVKLSNEADALVQGGEFLQDFRIDEFPDTNNLADIVWRVSEKKPSTDLPK